MLSKGKSLFKGCRVRFEILIMSYDRTLRRERKINVFKRMQGSKASGSRCHPDAFFLRKIHVRNKCIKGTGKQVICQLFEDATNKNLFRTAR